MMTFHLDRRLFSCLRYVASLALLAWLVVGLGPGIPVQAADIDVACDTAALIAAIHAANGTPEADTLNLAAGCTYTLTAVDNDTRGPNGLPVIDSDMTINGHGATIERSDAPGTPEFRILMVEYPASRVTLDQLTIRNGYLGGGDGGGIRVIYTRLSLAHCTITGNTASRGGGIFGEGTSEPILTDSTVSSNSGDGIYLDEAFVTLIDSAVSDNSGRGIRNYAGGATLTDSTVSDNGGRGIQSDGGPATLTHCTVSGNAGRGVSNNGFTTTLTNCTVSDNADGGIRNTQGALILTDSTVSGNTAESGGGILNEDVATITNSIISGNDSGTDGGGIFCPDGEMTLTGSTVSGNTSVGTGGGITHSSGRTMRIEKSTLSDNETQGIGGGIFIGPDSSSQALEIVNSTIAGNRAADSAGVAVDAGPVTFVNCTVSENTATQQGGGIGYGGGLDEVSLVNTILALNAAPTGPDCALPVTSLGHNLIGDPTGCTITLQPGDLTGDPGLDAYSDDGTPGLGLFPLLPVSRAVDAGNDGACPANDQRGVARPQDGDGDGTATCDIGAYELQVETNIELDAFTATAGVGQIALAWETGSEVDTAGFHLWRGETESGAYARITDALIPARGDAISGASYTYVDDGLHAGMTYWYKLEEVPTSGKGMLHGPVWATVKRGYSLHLPVAAR